jgi:hypothetical protein
VRGTDGLLVVIAWGTSCFEDVLHVASPVPGVAVENRYFEAVPLSLARSIVTEDGVKRPADVICFATGFQHNDFLAPMEISGREGVSLREQWGDEPRAPKSASEAPMRMAVFFAGNGFHSKDWWAKGEGKAMELGKVLTPLTDFREQTLFIRGLFNAEALKGNIHSSQTGNLLSGAPLAAGDGPRPNASAGYPRARDRGQTRFASSAAFPM